MTQALTVEKAIAEAWPDEAVVERILAGDTALFEVLMRRYNQRLYRAARAVLRDDAEAEDVMQDAYVRAYQHLRQFRAEAQFSTWLTRIAVHEAIARAKRRGRLDQLETFSNAAEGQDMRLATSSPNPEAQASAAETSMILERAILSIPGPYRTVLMLRDIEQMSTAETASVLDISEENVKTRLHRGRALVRKELYALAGSDAPRAFAFMGQRCDSLIRRVMNNILVQ